MCREIKEFKKRIDRFVDEINLIYLFNSLFVFIVRNHIKYHGQVYDIWRNKNVKVFTLPKENTIISVFE